MQTFDSSSDINKINEIEKLRKENEFLENELCRKKIIIQSLQWIPILDSNFRCGAYGEGFEYPQRKHVIKRNASMPMQTIQFKLNMNRFAPLDNSNSKENESNKWEKKAANNVKKQQLTKDRPRVSNIQTHDANDSNTKITSNFRSCKSRGSYKKQTSDKGDQKRKVHILGD